MIKSDEDIVVMIRIEDYEKGDTIMITMSHQILRLFFQTRGDVADAWPDSQLSSRETLEVIFDPGSSNEKNRHHHHLRSWIVVKIYTVNNKPFPPIHFSNFEYSRATEHHQIQQLCSDYSLMDNESVFQF